MGFTWTDWVRFIVTPLIIASITAIVSIRNAKKSPHERLKNLVDIHKNMPSHLDSKRVVEGAIARELVDFDRRLAADQRGFWAGVRERFVQVQVTSIIGAIAAASIVTISLTAFLAGNKPWTESVSAVASVVSGLVAVIGVAVTAWVYRKERSSLNRARALAEVPAHFPRLLMQEISARGQLDLAPSDYLFEVTERLARMGIFEKRAVTEGPDGQKVTFVLTSSGRKVLDAALADAQRQHIEHLEDDLAKEAWRMASRERKAAEEGEERGEGPGREAPGS